MSFGFYCFVFGFCFSSIRLLFFFSRNWTFLTSPPSPFDFDVGRATTPYCGMLFAVLFLLMAGDVLPVACLRGDFSIGLEGLVDGFGGLVGWSPASADLPLGG